MKCIRSEKTDCRRGSGRDRHLLAVAVVGLSLSLFALPAIGQEDEELRWFGDLTDGRALLAYGIPESDNTPLVLLCDKGDSEIRIYLPHEAVNATEGQKIQVRMSSNKKEFEFAAAAQPQEMDDLLHLEGRAKLDERLVEILTAKGQLTLTIEGRITRYPLEGAAEAAGHLIAVCGASTQATGDLEITLTNSTSTPIVGFLFSEAGVNDFDGDTYGNRVLAPGDSAKVVISNGRNICTFDLRAEFDDDAERDPVNGRQNLCENSAFIVHG